MHLIDPNAPLSDDDRAYITREYVTLEELCRGRRERPDELRTAMAARRLPRAPYVLSDGERVARDHLALADAAGGAERLPDEFARRLRQAARRLDEPLDDARVAEEWDAYLAGVYFVCLREATPENIVEKEQLVRRLSAWLAAPAPDAPAWCAAVRDGVERLDALERPFAACDRVRFGGPVSRDRLIDGARRAYPQLFAGRGA